MTRWLYFTGFMFLGASLPTALQAAAKAEARADQGATQSSLAVPPPAVIRRFAELEKLELQERQIFHALHGHKDPRVIYDMSWVRFQIANFKKAHGLFTPDEYRKFLFVKVIPPLQLNLRAWVKEHDEGQFWMGRSFLLMDEAMACAKRTIPNVPDGTDDDVVGKATYYGGETGAETHNGPTAHGDTFCMFGQTAAYMRAPLGSWIRVKNPKNGRWIDLRVNDTGGFERKGRVVDLSRGAYAYLKIVNNGNVQIRQIDPREAVHEPVLCDGRGDFDNKLHLERTHPGIPPAWRIASLK